MRFVDHHRQYLLAIVFCLAACAVAAPVQPPSNRQDLGQQHHWKRNAGNFWSKSKTVVKRIKPALPKPWSEAEIKAQFQKSMNPDGLDENEARDLRACALGKVRTDSYYTLRFSACLKSLHT